MMAVSLPTSGLNNMDTDNEALRILGYEDCFQNISKENMDQIRNTMMRHEALFKEQVRALHKLYNIQKSAMQEIRKVICSRAQVLPFSSDTISDRESQLHNFVAEGKPVRQASASPQARMEESHVFSLHPISAVKEFAGCDPKMSSWMNNAEVKTLPSVQNKLRNEIDLERLPEDYMDDFEIQNEANSYEILDSNTCLSEEARKKFQVSCLGSNLSVLQVESPSLNQRDTRSDIITLEPPGIPECCEQASETKSHKVYAKRCSTVIWSLQASQDNKLKDHPCNHLPAASNSLVHEESIQSFNQREEKPLWLHQGASLNKELHMYSTHEQIKGSNNSPGSTQMSQSLDSDHLVTASHLKLDEKQQNNSADGGSVSTVSAICPRSSSTLKHRDSKSLNNLCVQDSISPETESVSGKQNSYSWAITYQTSEDGGNEDPNCSGHGSNSVESHGGNICKEGNLSIFTINNNPKFGANFSEPVQMSQVAADGIQSEHEEAPRFTNVGVKPSPSPSVAGLETNHTDHGRSSNGSPENLTSQEEPVAVTESSENPKSVSTLEEACESIAAKILLSFAPCRSQGHAKGEGCQTQIEVESNISTRDVSKQGLRMRRSINYNDEGFINETVKWTKTVQGRRRTSRRPR